MSLLTAPYNALCYVIDRCDFCKQPYYVLPFFTYCIKLTEPELEQAVSDVEHTPSAGLSAAIRFLKSLRYCLR